MKLFVLMSLCLPFFISAKVLKYEVLGSKKEHFSYRDVCNKMGYRHLLLVEVIDGQIDCMGKKVLPSNFCKTVNLTDPNYIRGFLDKEAKGVVCQKGKDVALSVSCDKKIKKLCEDAKAGCIVLKDTFAVNLKLVHQTLLYQGQYGQVLSCHYSNQSI